MSNAKKLPARTAMLLGVLVCAGWAADRLVGAVEGALTAEAHFDHGVVGKSQDLDGVHGVSEGDSIADHGVFGSTDSTSTTDAGVRGDNTGSGPAVYGYKATGGDAAYGVRGRSAASHAVYGVSDAGPGNYGGWFSGRSGVFAQADDFIGSALRPDCPEADDVGCWAVDATSEGGHAVVGETDRADQNYGFSTDDNINVGGTCTGCTVAMIVRNGGGGELRVGDMVAVTGAGEALPQASEPTILVDRAGGGGVFGVVKNTLEIELISRPKQSFVEVERPDPEGGPPDTLWELRTEDREVALHHGVERPATPGDYLVIVVQGMARVKADASLAPIAPGDRLASLGHVALSSSATSDAGLQVVGTALEPMTQGQGLVWTWVDPG